MQSKLFILSIVAGAFLGATRVLAAFGGVHNYAVGRQHHTVITNLMMAKKLKFSIKENLAGSISSDGVFQGRETKERPVSSKLGVASKQKKNSITAQSITAQSSKSKTSTSGAPLSKKERQRTGNGNVDSTLSTRIAAPEKEDIQVLEAKRGGKSVTIVR
jgi:hypothetical protein